MGKNASRQSKLGMVICRHCREVQKTHVSNKCLFSPTLFDALRCKFCTGRLRETKWDMPDTDTPAHAGCRYSHGFHIR
jgi:hypothetical protein